MKSRYKARKAAAHRVSPGIVEAMNGIQPVTRQEHELFEMKTSIPTPPVIDSHALFSGRTEVLIAHEGNLYRLKITRQGKLILNK